MAPPIMQGQMMQPGMQQPAMQQPGTQQQMPGHMANAATQPQGVGPNKTVILQPSEGVVSVARTQQPIQPAAGGAVQTGASTLFWIVSLFIGIAIGALAYVIVLQTQ